MVRPTPSKQRYDRRADLGPTDSRSGEDLLIQRTGRAADSHEDFLRLSEKRKPPCHRAIDHKIEFITGLANRDLGYSKDRVMNKFILEVAGRLFSCRPRSDREVCAPAFESLPMFSPTCRPKVDAHRLTNRVVLLSFAVEFSEAISCISEFKS